MQVVVLPSPAVERIGVAVHVDELLLGDGSHTAKVVVVLESVVPLVDGHAQVLGVVLRTAVEIPVIKQKILIVRTIRMYKKIHFSLYGWSQFGWIGFYQPRNFVLTRMQ